MILTRRRNGDAKKRAEQEAKTRAAERQMHVYERLAGMMADLPDDEFAARVAEVFRRRPA